MAEDSTNTKNSSEQTTEISNDNPSTAHTSEFSNKLNAHEALASPFDRVAAFVVDHAIILLPVLAFILSPFKGVIAKLAYLDQLEDMVGLLFALGLFVFLTVLLYHTVFLTLWGATPGKRIFHLKVVHIQPDKQLGAFTYIIRTLFWLLGAAFMFLPHLAIFNHFLRRPMHDRFAHTLVINTKGEVYTPHPVEMSFARGMYSAFILIITLVIALPAMQVGKALHDQKQDPTTTADNANVLCDDVSEAVTHRAAAPENNANRLQVAITLFAGDEIDADCLDAEAEEAFKSKSQLSTVYFAKSLVHRDESELSDKYFERVCHQDKSSKVCAVTALLETPTPESWEQFKVGLLKDDDSQSFLKVWALKHSMKVNDFPMTQALLNQLNGFPKLNGFFSSMKAKSLWGLQKYREADVATAEALKLIEGEDQSMLAGWMCSEQLARSCNYSNQSACSNLKSAIEEDRRLLLSPRNSLAFIKTQECDQGNEVDYLPMIRQSVLSEAQIFLMVMRRSKGGDVRAFQNELLGLMRSPDLSDVFLQEVMLRLIKVSTDRPEVQKLVLKTWRESQYSLAWQRLGQALVKNYYQSGAFELAAKLGDRIISQQQALNHDFQQDLVLANYKASRLLRAFEVLNRPSEDPVANRELASTDEFERVSGLLSKKFRKVSR